MGLVTPGRRFGWSFAACVDERATWALLVYRFRPDLRPATNRVVDEAVSGLQAMTAKDRHQLGRGPSDLEGSSRPRSGAGGARQPGRAGDGRGCRRSRLIDRRPGCGGGVLRGHAHPAQATQSSTSGANSLLAAITSTSSSSRSTCLGAEHGLVVRVERLMRVSAWPTLGQRHLVVHAGPGITTELNSALPPQHPSRLGPGQRRRNGSPPRSGTW